MSQASCVHWSAWVANPLQRGYVGVVEKGCVGVEEPAGARGSQEEWVGARGSQGEPGGASRS